MLPDIHTLITALPRGARLIGIDPGSKLIGLALSDVERRLASPLKTIARRKMRENVQDISLLALREGVGGLVIGCPFDEDGRLGPSGQAARDWGRAVSEALGLPACLWDESLTTHEVESFLIGHGMSRNRRAEAKDRAAAALILQQALDEANRSGG